MSEATHIESRHCPCTGACCHHYMVNLCGYDVWLVSTRLRLRPEEFAVPVLLKDPGNAGFRLEPSGRQYALALDKRRWGSRGKVSERGPCIFLVRMTDGVERCGIHAIRPVACRVYPMAVRNADLAQRSDAMCPAGSWVLDERQKREWHRSLSLGRMQFDIYAEVLARWNARVDAAASGTRFSILEFFDYLLNVYEPIERLIESTGTEEIDDIVATWPIDPGTTDQVAGAGTSHEQESWIRYLRAVRDILGRFYRDVPLEPTPGA